MERHEGGGVSGSHTNLELQLNCGEITQNKLLNNSKREAL